MVVWNRLKLAYEKEGTSVSHDHDSWVDYCCGLIRRRTGLLKILQERQRAGVAGTERSR